jgi:tetratricopeptide (TPR) repeat protein
MTDLFRLIVGILASRFKARATLEPENLVLRHDDHPNVANLIGYSYRKLGDYKLSQVWYERALKADPNHVLTWQYYGLWQIEQGNRDQAEYHLRRIAAICGTDCEEYRSLADALEKPPGTGPVY